LALSEANILSSDFFLTSFMDVFPVA